MLAYYPDVPMLEEPPPRTSSAMNWVKKPSPVKSEEGVAEDGVEKVMNDYDMDVENHIEGADSAQEKVGANQGAENNVFNLVSGFLVLFESRNKADLATGMDLHDFFNDIFAKIRLKFLLILTFLI